jgi:uncharacterized SAM-binding protein YcdF (DUF218 family)
LKLKTFYFISCLILLAAALYYAPFFLIVSDPPVKSDAVVLFLGGEKGTREKEADQLIRDGFADYLIIPAYRQVKKLNPDGILIKIDSDVKPKTSNLKPFFEDTHSEAIIAHDMMERLGISSATLVSSPYHMRRIKMIAEKVFGDGQTVNFVPTRYETPSDGFWLFNNYDRKFVLTEYAKITWFLLYSSFTARPI